MSTLSLVIDIIYLRLNFITNSFLYVKINHLNFKHLKFYFN